MHGSIIEHHDLLHGSVILFFCWTKTFGLVYTWYNRRLNLYLRQQKKPFMIFRKDPGKNIYTVQPYSILLADMEKVCLLPRPDLRIFNNFRIISGQKLTIFTFYTNKWMIFTLKLSKFTRFHHFEHKRGLVYSENNHFVQFM